MRSDLSDTVDEKWESEQGARDKRRKRNAGNAAKQSRSIHTPKPASHLTRDIADWLKSRRGPSYIEGADEPGGETLRVYPFDGPPLIITIRPEN